MSAREGGAIRRLAVLACAIGVLAPPLSAAEMRILAVERVTPSESVQPLARGATPGTRLRLAGPSHQFDLLLEPNTDLLPGGQSGATTAWRGSLPGLPGSWARLTRRAGRYQGIYSDGVQVYIVERAGSAARASGEAATMDPDAHLIYRLSDVQISGALFEGDMRDVTRTGADTLALIGAQLMPATGAAVLTTKRLDVAVVADTELVGLDGANTDPKVIDRMSIVDGIFSSQVGVQLRLASTTHVDSAAESLTSTASSTLLDALKAYRLRSGVQQAAGLTHLMTGRDLDGQTVGIAFINSLCSRGFSASLSEARNSVSFDALIAAHEIGHVFGAPHDGDAAAACASTPETFLMAPRLNGSSTFSDCSLTQMAPTVASASCLAQIDAADAAVSVPTSTPLALNQATTVSFTVTSVGNATVTGVAITVTLPSGVTINGGGATGGSCSTGSSLFTCTLGDLPAGTNREIQMSLTGSVAGASAATVQLTATNDGLAANNRSSLALTTAPGADLSAAATADASQVIVGQTTTLHVTLRNLGLAAAPDATFTVTVPTGLTLTAATMNGLSCTLTDGALDCPAFALAADAQATLDLTLRADQTGALAVALALRSPTLADPQPGNNAVTLTLTGATAPAQPATTGGSSGGGGGGSGAGLLAVLGLSIASRMRRRAARHRSL
jgi:uncharacterized repeat protein (TIGR01451 family)